MHDQARVVGKPGIQHKRRLQVGMPHAVDEALQHACGIPNRFRARNGQPPGRQRAPAAIERKLHVDRLSARHRVPDGHWWLAGGLESDIRPDAASPSGAIQDDSQRGINRIVVFCVDILPPPGHGGSHGTAEGSAPDALAPSAQVKIVGVVPAARIGAEFADHHGLAITLEKRLGRRGEAAGRSRFTIRMISRKIELRQGPDFRAIAVAGKAGRDEVAEPIVRMQPPAHHAVPGCDIRGVEEGVIIVDLVEEFPGKQVLAITIARNQIPQPLLIQLLSCGVREEIVRDGTGATIGHVIWVLRPVIVAAPHRIRLADKHAVVIEAEQNIDPAQFSKVKHVIQLPRGLKIVVGECCRGVLNAKLPRTHPDSSVILTRALHGGKPGIVAVGGRSIPPANILTDQPQRLAIAGLEVLVTGSDADISKAGGQWASRHAEVCDHPPTGRLAVGADAKGNGVAASFRRRKAKPPAGRACLNIRLIATRKGTLVTLIPESRHGCRPPGRQRKPGIQSDDIRVKGIGRRRDIADAEFEMLPELRGSQLADLRRRLREPTRQHENQNCREQPSLCGNIHAITDSRAPVCLVATREARCRSGVSRRGAECRFRPGGRTLAA